MTQRPAYPVIFQRVKEPRRFIQVLLGPRQVGKTAMVLHLIENIDIPCHYATADSATLQDLAWIRAQWEIARQKTKEEGLLIIDEVQKILHWSEVIKDLWDEDTRDKTPLKVIILGSSPWLVERGLSESLAGRFEILPMPHWSFQEMHKAFGWDLDTFIFFGGYPGAAPLVNIDDHSRWLNYINDALIETTLSRDILLMTQVNKPALLRSLFQLGCQYSGQIFSYNKVLGQLLDAGNTTTLSHYLELLTGAGLLAGLQKFANSAYRKKGSSPKFQVFNTALFTAQSSLTFSQAKEDPSQWGRLVESAVGAHLLNTIRGTNIELFYWNQSHLEVDFILQKGNAVTAIEVASGNNPHTMAGLSVFSKSHPHAKILLIGKDGIAIEEFLSKPASEWV